MYNTFVKNLCLLIVALVVSAFIVEVAARSAGFTTREVRINPFFIPDSEYTWSVPDPELGWINKEGVSRSIEEGNVPMTFWDFGRRATRASSYLSPKGWPIMVIGGSNAQSYGVRDEESFVYILSKRYPQIWFENFGNGGYGTVQSLILAKRAYRDFYTNEKPKLIILAFDDSHALRNVSDQSWVYSISDEEGRYVAPPHYRVRDGSLAFYPFRTIGFWPLEKHSALITLLHNVWLQSFTYNTAGDAIEVTHNVIERLHDYALESGSQLAVVVLEDRTQISDGFFADKQFPYQNCSGFERSDPEAYLLGGTSHPNARLHAYLADCIGTWLESDVFPLLDLPNAHEPGQEQ